MATKPSVIIKRKKSQAVDHLTVTKANLLDLLTALEYYPEHASIYVETVQMLQHYNQSLPELTTIEIYEKIRQEPNIPDLGTRYKYLIPLVESILNIDSEIYKLSTMVI